MHFNFDDSNLMKWLGIKNVDLRFLNMSNVMQRIINSNGKKWVYLFTLPVYIHTLIWTTNWQPWVISKIGFLQMKRGRWTHWKKINAFEIWENILRWFIISQKECYCEKLTRSDTERLSLSPPRLIGIDIEDYTI